jgi:hypothetical protein
MRPVPTQLRDFSADLEQARSSADDLSARLGQLQRDLRAVNVDVSESVALLDRYEATTSEAQALASRARDDLRSQARWARTLVVLLGVAFAAGQLLPLWMWHARPLPPPPADATGGGAAGRSKPAG